MIELPLTYWNTLANQTIFISSLLGGFSLTLIASLLVTKSSDPIIDKIFKVAAIATASFLVAIFAMTKILMMTTQGYPFEVNGEDLMFPRLVGIIAFLSGIISLITIVSFAGWVKSKNMGRFTTIIGVLSLILILAMLT